METERIIEKLKADLTEKRFSHTLRVAETSVELAKRFNVDTEVTERAALLHDYAKCRPIEELRRWVTESNLPKDLLNHHHELLHGPVGSLLIQRELGITDQVIIDAVYVHTTGRPYMTKIEQIIFVADYIEPGRDFPGLDEVRNMAQLNLLKTTWMVSRNTIMYLMGKNATVYPDSIHTYNQLTDELKQEGIF